jgi:hypothetical protein
MFAGEGGPARTNRRFHLLCRGPARHPPVDRVRLGHPLRRATRPTAPTSTARSASPACRRDLDDMKRSSTRASTSARRPPRVDDHQRPGARSCSRCSSTPPSTSSSPRPRHGRARPPRTSRRRCGRAAAPGARHGAGRHPQGGPGPEHLHLLHRVRPADDGRHPEPGSSQHEVRNFYSVSISGYHIAEAGANPISQLAFTLANGFTYVESTWPAAWRSTTSRRTSASSSATAWTPSTPCSAASPAASGRSPCATATAPASAARSSSTTCRPRAGRCTPRRWQFNDIRTTLQALCALYDNCNSLHTNAYDEAVTTPTAESVRRAMAIQLIITASGASP